MVDYQLLQILMFEIVDFICLVLILIKIVKFAGKVGAGTSPVPTVDVPGSEGDGADQAGVGTVGEKPQLFRRDAAAAYRTHQPQEQGTFLRSCNLL